MSVVVSTIPDGVRLTAGMTCPRCEGPMNVLSAAQPLTREWKAVVRCDRCHAEQLLLVRLLDYNEIADAVTGTRAARAQCGTDAGQRAHRRRGEPICDDCRTAHNVAERARAARRRTR